MQCVSTGDAFATTCMRRVQRQQIGTHVGCCLAAGEGGVQELPVALGGTVC